MGSLATMPFGSSPYLWCWTSCLTGACTMSCGTFVEFQPSSCRRILSPRKLGCPMSTCPECSFWEGGDRAVGRLGCLCCLWLSVPVPGRLEWCQLLEECGKMPGVVHWFRTGRLDILNVTGFICLFFCLYMWCLYMLVCAWSSLMQLVQLVSFSSGSSPPPEHWDYRWAAMSPSFYVGAGTQFRSPCLHDKHFLKIILKQ